jgi:hypothetical protein
MHPNDPTAQHVIVAVGTGLRKLKRQGLGTYTPLIVDIGTNIDTAAQHVIVAVGTGLGH